MHGTQAFWQTLTSHPMTPWLGWLGLGILVIFWMIGQIRPHLHEDPIEKLQKTLGAEGISGWIVTIAVFMWGALLLVLFAGLITFLADIAWSLTQPVTNAEKADVRFLLTKTTALTAVLAAAVALPFTVIRIKLSAEQNRHAQDVLYNDKLNEAVESLHARYQVTTDGKDVWQDDIIKRNGAIDRLEALAAERPHEASRIARTLCVYLRELTREYPAEKPPEEAAPEALFNWVRGLTVKRSDMETAAQVLGRMHDKTKVPPKDLAIDLSGVNLQAMRLDDANFEHATMNNAFMDGAQLNWAELNGAQLNGAQLNKDTDLRATHTQGLALRSVDLSKVPHIADFVKSAFGDASVILPDDVGFPNDRWPNTKLDNDTYWNEWDLFKKDPDAYIPPQHRND